MIDREEESHEVNEWDGRGREGVVLVSERCTLTLCKADAKMDDRNLPQPHPQLG